MPQMAPSLWLPIFGLVSLAVLMCSSLLSTPRLNTTQSFHLLPTSFTASEYMW